LIEAERTAWLGRREREEINDEVWRSIQRDLDLDELRMEAYFRPQDQPCADEIGKAATDQAARLYFSERKSAVETTADGTNTAPIIAIHDIRLGI